MENNIPDLNKPVDFNQTSFRDKYIHDIDEILSIPLEKKSQSKKDKAIPNNSKGNTTPKEIALTNLNSNTSKINMGADDTQWFYATKYSTEGDIYNVDKKGNLIASFNHNAYGAFKQTHGDKINEEDVEQVKKILNQCRQQIDFVKEQENLKEEIKGYPELNEKILQLYQPDKTLIRFKSERNALKAIINPKNELRYYLTLAYLNKNDLFFKMIEDNVIEISNSNSYIDKVKTFMIRYAQAFNVIPSVQEILRHIELPYSEEFVKEYIYDEQTIETWVKGLYMNYRIKIYKEVSKVLQDYKGPVEDIINNYFEKIKDPFSLTFKEDAFNDLQQYLEEKKNEIILSTGIKELNDQNVYLPKGKICSVFAYTGNFKTMFCSNIAYNIIKNGGNVLYLSLEISKSEMYINFLSRHSYNYDKKLSHSDIKANRISEEDNEYLFNSIYPNFKDNLKKHLIVLDEADITSNSYQVFNQLLSEADQEFIKQTGEGIDLIVVDHLNLLKFGIKERIQNDYSAVNHWMSYFRKNAIDFLGKKKQVAILCACQSSREGYKEAVKNGGYRLTSIAEGNEIERSSAYVLSIYTSKTDRENNQTKMQILKMRDESPNEDSIQIDLEPKYYAFGIEKKNQEQEPDKNKHYDIPKNDKQILCELMN